MIVVFAMIMDLDIPYLGCYVIMIVLLSCMLCLVGGFTSTLLFWI